MYHEDEIFNLRRGRVENYIFRRFVPTSTIFKLKIYGFKYTSTYSLLIHYYGVLFDVEVFFLGFDLCGRACSSD